MQKKENQIKDLEDLLKRLQADFDNYRKRTEQDRSEIKKSANAELFLSLLPVLDNFKRAAQHAPENDNWTNGIKAIEKQLEEILKRHNFEPIDVKPGDQFDPALHEVLSHQPSPDRKPNSIIKIVENGYQLNGKILRPAKVFVA